MKSSIAVFRSSVILFIFLTQVQQTTIYVDQLDADKRHNQFHRIRREEVSAEQLYRCRRPVLNALMPEE